MMGSGSSARAVSASRASSPTISTMARGRAPRRAGRIRFLCSVIPPAYQIYKKMRRLRISDGSVTVGTPFGGSVVVDISAVDLDPSPTQRVYEFDGPTFSASAVVGPFIVFTLPPAGPADSSFRVTFVNGSP